MRPRTALSATAVALVLGTLARAASAQDDYEPGPDSKRQEGVLEGKVEGPFVWSQSKIFPGTTRRYWIYVPAQYDAQKPACTLVVQDGLGRARGWRLPVVLDNLIHREEVPVTVGVFIEPGVVPAGRGDSHPRFNRSFEYDSMGDRYARFLIEEILPEVAKTYALSDDPNDRAIAGASSGGICAFTVAWERPDAFRRVLSTIGTFVGLRGGNEYPTLVRKCEPKPIRIFLQDGSRDLNLYGGDWWAANRTMLSALEWAGYDVEHVWGTGGHNGKHSTAILPEALRWLWRDHPRPVRAGTGGDPRKRGKRRTDILLPDERWELVSEGHGFTDAPAVNAAGEVFFSDVPSGKIHRVGLDGKVSVFVEYSRNATGLMFGPEGRLHACRSSTQEIVRYDAAGKEQTVVSRVTPNDLVVLRSGLYFTDPTNRRLWHVDAAGKATVVDEGIGFPNGVISSADQAFLLASDSLGRFLYSFRIAADGKLEHKQRYGWVHLGDEASGSGADGMTVDTQGRLYVASMLGVQVFDQLGRVHLILAKPHGAWLSAVVFGGPELDTLYATCGDRVYRRKLKAKGVVPWQAPVKPPRPRL